MEQYYIVQGISAEGFSLLTDLWRGMQKACPDLLVMELEYADGDGFHALKAIHEKFSVPIIVASAKNSESDRIICFELGCDDFVGKPYSRKELTLRSLAILRRKKRHFSQISVWYLREEKFSINWEAHQAEIDGRCLGFTASEWRIISHLVGNAGTLVSRLQLLQSCFPESLESYDRIIDTHIKNIRAKLGPNGQEWMETVRGYGYRFRGSSIRA